MIDVKDCFTHQCKGKLEGNANLKIKKPFAQIPTNRDICNVFVLLTLQQSLRDTNPKCEILSCGKEVKTQESRAVPTK